MPQRWAMVVAPYPGASAEQVERLILRPLEEELAEVHEIYRVTATARAGVDNREGSGGTPPGLHRVARLIGADAAPGTVFVGREATDRLWQPADQDPDDLRHCNYQE